MTIMTATTMTGHHHQHHRTDSTNNHRTLFYGTTECADGTICENSSTCLAHPTKEGSYMCDCTAAENANDPNTLAKFAGVYCEHQATTYCQKGGSSTGSSHTFCTNGGECKFMVGKKEEHAGCKCPKGYTGDYCQFVRGSMPSDWTIDNFMHPALVNAYGSANNDGMGTGGIIGIVMGVGFVMIASILVMYLYCGFIDLRTKLRRSEKEMDTAFTTESNTTGVAMVVDVNRGSGTSVRPQGSPKKGEFIGGQSVYKRKSDRRTAVTPDSLEADGGVLTEALEDKDPVLGANVSMEEVSLDDLPSALNQGAGELA